MGVLGAEWQRGPVIGRGASATVSIAVDRRTGEMFAVKSVDAALAGALRREQSVLAALSGSPYVVSCAGSGVSAAAGGTRCELLLELAPGGSLVDEARRCGGRCEEPLVRSRAGDVVRALAHVHGAGIAHCDVKGRNVLVGADGRAKLADFGCARRTTAGEDGGGNAAAAIIRGTPMFLAPEAARGEAQGTAADIWALGCTVVEMATGGAPWPRFADPVAALHHVAHSGDVPEAPAWFSEEGKDFLARCLVRDPAERWTAERLLEHPFVAVSPAADSGSKAAPVGQWVSPKSILDQAVWEDSAVESEPDAATAVTPAERLSALAAGAAGLPDWTWSGEEWIAVCGGHADSNGTTFAPQFNSIVGEEEHASSSGGGGGSEITGVDAARGDGSSHGHRSSSAHGDASPSCKSVIGGCNNDDDCSNFSNTSNVWHWSINFLPSWQLLLCVLSRAPFRFFTFHAASFSSRARREPQLGFTARLTAA